MPHVPREHEAIRRGARSRIACCAALLALASSSGVVAEDETHHVTGVRFWSLGDITRIAVETDGDFRARTDRLHNPERIFFDFVGTQPALGQKAMTVIPVGDKIVRQIRVAETQHGVTRVVLDMESVAEVTTSRLDNPDRLMIEVKMPGAAATAKTEKAAPVREAPPPPKIEVVKEVAKVDVPKFDAPPPKPVEYRPFVPPPAATPQESSYKRTQVAMVEPPPVRIPLSGPPPAAVTAKLQPAPIMAPPPAPLIAKNTPAPATSTPAVAGRIEPTAMPAKRNASGDRSMIRVLGLKVGRIVIDPGHGGHDTGTIGPGGLREKDLVLDVSRRLGALIEARLGSEVIYTRADDTFIALERRTEIANEAKADLFLSIHANSSTIAAASGVETYYLNLTTSRSALELAARENAGAQRSIFDLQDLLQKIAVRDKVEESREFAARIESALYPVSAKANSKAKDRGVKKAPFVVLIGATMPSVLAEIGFISNDHDESNMRHTDYRQHIAEALFKGLSNYANTLSHFQVAQRE